MPIPPPTPYGCLRKADRAAEGGRDGGRCVEIGDRYRDGMDLEEFVAETIRQVVSGVVRAQREAHSLGARVYPIMTIVTPSPGIRSGEDAEGNSRQVYEIAFDIAVTARSETGSNAGVKARLYVVEAGVGGRSASQNTVVSRVSFSIPVVYPVHSGRPPA
jgi:hypothetical protein